MIKKFALLATVAAFVACSSENTESMESPQTETTQEAVETPVAEPEAVVAPETTETEEVMIEETEAPVEEGVVIEENN